MSHTYQAADNRYEKMLYRRAGASGLLFPAISLGFWHNFGENDNPDNMRAMMRTAFDLGISQFDLANNYGPQYGRAEKNAGKFLAEDFKPYRDELVISSKAGYDMWPGPYGNWGSRKYLIASADQSLNRLGLDYVDIFYHHRPDPNTPLAETLDALKSIVDAGKAIYAGISNYNAEQTRAAVRYARKIHLPLIVNQSRYSIFDRKIERMDLPGQADEDGIGIIAFSPLAQGLLSDRYLDGIPADSRIAHDGRYLKREDLTENKLSAARRLQEIARDRGQSLAQMALAWDLRLPQISSVIIGASSPAQIKENVDALERLDFSPAELTKIDEITAGI